MQQRPESLRQQSPLRKPWHIDYLVMRELVSDIIASSSYARGRLLDVGSGNQPYQRWLRGVTEYIGIDINHQTSRPAVGGLAYALPFAANSFDTVFSTQTLEHVEAPDLAVAEMARVLRPGGYLILTAPQTWRLHEKPYDFYRYTRFGLQYLLEHNGLQVVEIEAQGGVWVTIGQTFNNAVHRRWGPHLPIYAIYLIYLASNILFSQLDQFWVDTDETLNYLVIGIKT
ncbi:MAG: class I SAM-dependent methyltransferase [Roseiflexaceae bacterium]